jgi:hypothetical protein
LFNIIKERSWKRGRRGREEKRRQGGKVKE